MSMDDATPISVPPVKEREPAFVALSAVLELRETLDRTFGGLDAEVARVFTSASNSLTKIARKRFGIR